MTQNLFVNPSSVVLATGGANGITARCVIKLAQRVKCKFILLGLASIDKPLPVWAKNGFDEAEIKKHITESLLAEGEKPTPVKVQDVFKQLRYQREVEENLQKMREIGSSVEYICVDVTDASALQEKLAGAVQKLGPVTGIIHGAGSLADKLIEKKTEKDFEIVVSPKVDGLGNLLDCVPASQLQFLVLFSSIVSVYGNAGQADYAIANEILNKYAYRVKRINPSCHVVSFNWGPWDTGMVTPELRKVFAANNVQLIPAEVGAAMLVEELTSARQNNVQVVVGGPLPRLAGKLETDRLCQYQVKRRLTLDANPFLHDHKIGENPVLPATCAAAWVANTCEQLYPGYKFFNLEYYKVLKGIAFDGKQAEEYILDMKEVSKSETGEIVFETLVFSQNKSGKPFNHYSLRVTLRREIPPMPVDAPPDVESVAKDEIIPGRTLYQNGTLFHGPSFQGVDQVLHISPEKLVMRLMLPKVDEKKQGQFPVQTSNPYINDAIIQSVLVWSQHIHKAPCLPAGLQKLEQYKPIPFGETCYATMEIRSQSEYSVLASVRVQDREGRTYLRIDGMQGTISPQLNRFIGVTI